MDRAPDGKQPPDPSCPQHTGDNIPVHLSRPRACEARAAGPAPLRRQLAALLRHGVPPGPAASRSPAASPGPLDPGPLCVDPARLDWSRLDWPALQRLAAAERLDALLYAALLGAHRLDAPPPLIRTRLAAAYWRTKVANHLVLAAVDQLVDALAAVDVPVVVLKGAALAFTLYDDPACRPLGDIDLLVHPQQVAVALRVLLMLGYAPLPNSLAAGIVARIARGDRRIFCRRSQVTVVRGGRVPTAVDLHWGLNSRALLRRTMDVAWFWDHTCPAHCGRCAVHVFTAEAQLLHLCAHTLQHGVPRLRWTYDIALLLARRTLAWDVVLAGAQRCGLGVAVQSSLAAVALIWGLAPPVWVQDLLKALPVSRAEIRLRRAVVSGDRRVVAAVDLLSQPDIGSALAAWSAAALPPSSYMLERYKNAGNHLLPACYLLHAVRGAALGGLGLLRALGSRSGRTHQAGYGGDPPPGAWPGSSGSSASDPWGGV